MVSLNILIASLASSSSFNCGLNKIFKSQKQIGEEKSFIYFTM